MTPPTTLMPSGTLREEDLEVGRRFVHPQTFLEYEDWHAYFAGKDPLPHYRNTRLARAIEARSPEHIYVDLRFVVRGEDAPANLSFEQYLPLLYEHLRTCYDTDGYAIDLGALLETWGT